MSIPSDIQIREEMEELMKVVDLETMSTKQFIAALSTKFGGVDLSAKKKFIKASITEIIDAMEKDDSDDDEDDVSEDESSEEELHIPKRKAAGGLSAVKEISDELAAFLNCGKHMARTAIVKSLWAYIKENNLQNPNDKREIMLDAKMKKVFGVDTFTMFSMNKYIGAHVEPFKPVDLTTNTPKKRKAKEDPKQKSSGKKKTGSQAPYRLSDALTAVCGKEILPRPQVTQGLWAYIRENDLQNPSDKREILCDTLLSRVMGGKKKVTMFTMNKHITPHLLERVDRSEYHHEESDSEEESGEDGLDTEEEESD